MLVNGKVVPKGKYTLYAIPTEEKWTIIVNKETDIWGAFKYDAAKDSSKSRYTGTETGGAAGSIYHVF